MAKKNLISEERLQQIIQESIYEVLAEGQYDEGFGHWLGKTFQGLRNKWNNFKGDFKAGQHKARWDNRDYDSFSEFGDEADDIRNFGGREYGAYRYNLAADRRANAKQYTTDKVGSNGGSMPKITPHPDLGGQVEPNSGATQAAPATPSAQTQSAPAAPTTPQQSSPAQTTQGAQSAVGPKLGPQSRMDNTKAIKQQLEKTLMQMGMTPQYDKVHKQNIIGWKGKRNAAIKKIIGDWRGTCHYPTLNEHKEKLTQLINEVAVLKQKNRNRKRK
jgi:hypothetical protein